LPAGAALAWPRDPAASSLLAGLRATAAETEAFGPRAYGKVWQGRDERVGIIEEERSCTEEGFAMTLRERRWVCLTRGQFRVGTGSCGSIDGEFVSGQETEKK